MPYTMVYWGMSLYFFYYFVYWSRSMAIRKWSELRGLPVVIPAQGRSTGTVEDFYYKLEINSIYALRIKPSMFGEGYRVLSASAIKSIERDAVNVVSDTMLIAEANSGHLLELPTGSSLLSC